MTVHWGLVIASAGWEAIYLLVSDILCSAISVFQLLNETFQFHNLLRKLAIGLCQDAVGTLKKFGCQQRFRGSLGRASKAILGPYYSLIAQALNCRGY